MYFLLKMEIFQGHVSFQGCRFFLKLSDFFSQKETASEVTFKGPTYFYHPLTSWWFQTYFLKTLSWGDDPV